MSSLLFVYLLPLLLIWLYYAVRRRRFERASRAAQAEAEASGLAEPVSLHPVIDPLRCIGCGSCVKACPEQSEHRVLGLINGKAQLVTPTDCIGHGACRAACPADAITLVFGSERRGVDIPVLSPDFESTVPGIYVAGELGGMGLIRNALAQGSQAVDAIARTGRRASAGHYDLLIVGAGPAGFAASLAAKSHGLRFVTIEQESLGGCVFQYPRAKLVMTQPAEIPLIGKVRFRQSSKEELLEFWTGIERKTGIGANMRYRERVESIERRADGQFVVRTSNGEYVAAAVLLAIGRRGTPRKLGVPGEDLAKVVYRLIDPAQYAGSRVLVVGGGDSALEAAISIAEAGGEVTLSYRGDAFARAKPRNREALAAAQLAGRLQVVLESQVERIERDRVLLRQGGDHLILPNDAVIVSVGGILPTEFLQRVGICVETKYGTA
jgi:thioredoxin reductase/NAD-dependent dihydropyrimidine dehydrogenase PreA subunit